MLNEAQPGGSFDVLARRDARDGAAACKSRRENGRVSGRDALNEPGVYRVLLDPQPLNLGNNIAFGQGTADPARTSIDFRFRNEGAPGATNLQFSYAWNAARTQVDITVSTVANPAVATDANFDLVIFASNRSGALGAS